MSNRRPKFRPSFPTRNGVGNYGHLVGKFVDLITTDFGNPHARLIVNVGADRYEVDVNVYSTLKSARFPNGSEVQFAIRDEAVDAAPAVGVDDTTTLAYTQLGLHQADFTSVDEDTLHDKIDALARASELVEIFGVLYKDANAQGIHDVHMNSGEGGAPADDTAKDGAIAFYSLPQAGESFAPHAQWVFIKFATQVLP
jgi:hypothetical protein